ncbi:MAG TPA: DUF4332 domain-containing protein [Chromatiales bacterium]|nr:DUF4332 domain-containing protein [Chromatiales bacterium]
MMDYLITKIALCLLIAFLLGIVIGRLMKRFATVSQADKAGGSEDMATLMSQQHEEEQQLLKELLDDQIEARKSADEKLLEIMNEMELLNGQMEKLKREKERLVRQLDQISEEKQALKEESFSLTADLKMVKKQLMQKLDAVAQKFERSEQERNALEERLKAADDELASLRGIREMPPGADSGDRRLRDDYPVDEIEGIGKGFKKRLLSLAITTTHQLLAKGSRHEDRQSIATGVGVEEFVVNNWIVMADLLRVPGIDGQFAELLLASGVQSVSDLATRQPDALTREMEKINEQEHRAPATPSNEMVTQWIRYAESLTP